MSSVEEMRRHMNRIRGELFQLVEATGMSDKQEDAFKGLIRQLTYRAQADLEQFLKERS